MVLPFVVQQIVDLPLQNVIDLSKWLTFSQKIIDLS